MKLLILLAVAVLLTRLIRSRLRPRPRRPRGLHPVMLMALSAWLWHDRIN